MTGQSRAMAYGHSSGLPPWEAPVMIAEKHKLFFFFLTGQWRRNVVQPLSTEPGSVSNIQTKGVDVKVRKAVIVQSNFLNNARWNG